MNASRGKIFLKEERPCVNSVEGRLIWLHGQERGEAYSGEISQLAITAVQVPKAGTLK